MKIPVSDASVDEFVGKLRAGIPTGQVFPARMSDCAFTEAQRIKIRAVRAEKKSLRKTALVQVSTKANSKPVAKTPAPTQATPPRIPTPKSQTKLQKLLYLQTGRCFFCGEHLRTEDASIEHLNPKSRGGTNAQDNLVVCHKSLNATFGDMELKQKFEFVLKSAGCFKCPSR